MAGGPAAHGSDRDGHRRCRPPPAGDHDPRARQRAGYAVPMPQAPISDEEVDLLVAHVQSVG